MQLKAHLSNTMFKVLMYIVVEHCLPVNILTTFQRIWRSPLYYFTIYLRIYVHCASADLCVRVCTCVDIFPQCPVSASCHSWTTHGHICQCHEVEPFPARAGNLSHFPRVFWPLFFFLFHGEPMKMCNTKKKKNAITFSRGYYWVVGGYTLIWMCLSFTETGAGSLHALRSRTRSVPGVGPAARHGQLLWGSYRWDSHRTNIEAGNDGYAGKHKRGMHFEWTKYVNLFLKG